MSKIKGKWAGMQVGATMDPENRPKGDFYSTVPEAIEGLLSVEEFHTKVWEPACGTGAIVNELIKAGKSVIATDLYVYEADFEAAFGVDFLTSENHPTHVDIITNPPFSQALEFARRGVKILSEGHKMALFGRLAWLESKTRKPFFQGSPLKRVWVHSARLPMMHRPGFDGKKIKRGTVAYAWYVWEKGYSGPAMLGWI